MAPEIDRTQVCPFLLRCYWKFNRHSNLEDYRQVTKDIYPPNEIVIYTWKDATLRELSNLVLEAIQKQQDEKLDLSFSVVYPDKMGIFALKNIGNLCSTEEGQDDSKCLEDIEFHVGDMLDICIKQPNKMRGEGHQPSSKDNFRGDRPHGGRGRGGRARNDGRSRY